MVTTHNVESEIKEIQDKVRTRASIATDPGEGMAELGQQIAKLMATMTKAGQGSNPSLVCQVVLGREAVGGATMVAILTITQTPSMVEVALDRPPKPAVYPLGVGQGAMELGVMARATKRLAQRGRAQLIG